MHVNDVSRDRIPSVGPSLHTHEKSLFSFSYLVSLPLLHCIFLRLVEFFWYCTVVEELFILREYVYVYMCVGIMLYTVAEQKNQK